MRVLATQHVDHYTIGLYSQIMRHAEVTLLTNYSYDLNLRQIRLTSIPYLRRIHRTIVSKLQRQYDIIHANSSDEGSLFSKNEHLLVTEHGFPRLDLPEPEELPFYKRELARLQLLHAEGVPIIAISNYARSVLKNDLGVNAKKVIYHGLLEAFRAPKVRQFSKIPVILFASRFVGAKKPFDFLEALDQLPKSLEFKAVIVGEGPLRGKMSSYIKLKNLETKVTFAQQIPFKSMPALYNSSNFYVHTCPTEGFGFSVLEAMGSGLPVIVPSEGGAKEIAGESALSYTPGNTWELADEITKLMINAEIYEKFSEKSISRSSEFTWEKAASEYLSIYDDIFETESS